MIAATSGGLGDIVYSIPILKELKVKTLYVKESYYFHPYGNLYTSIKRLVEQHDIACLPTDGKYPPHEYHPDLRFDFDLDLARKERHRGTNHIIKSYLNCFKLDIDYKKPFLSVTGYSPISKPYSIIQRTPRWRQRSKVDWKTIIPKIEYPVFVGFLDEYYDFCKVTGSNIPCYGCDDILDMAVLIRDCEAFYGNQSVGLTLAQGLGKKYFLERNPGKTNAIMKTPNENIL